MLLELVGVVLGGGESESRSDDSFDTAAQHDDSVQHITIEAMKNARRVVGQIEEKSNSIQRTVLLEILSEESSGLHVDSHSGKDDGEVVLVSIVNTLGRSSFGVSLGGELVDQSGLSTDLSGNLHAWW